jgi:hypothetical protein
LCEFKNGFELYTARFAQFLFDNGFCHLEFIFISANNNDLLDRGSEVIPEILD